MTPEVAKLFAATIALLPMIGAAIALALIFSNWLQAIARNPEAAPRMFTVGVIGFALTEAIAIFALGVGLLILFT